MAIHVGGISPPYSTGGRQIIDTKSAGTLNKGRSLGITKNTPGRLNMSFKKFNMTKHPQVLVEWSSLMED